MADESQPTHTNLYVRWDSAHPETQKLGIFRTLLWNAKNICSTQELYLAEKRHLLAVFQELGYPLKRLLHQVRNIESPVSKERTGKSDYTNLSLPYVPGLTEKNARTIKNALQLHGVQDLDYTITHRPISKLRSLLVHPYPKDPPGQCVYEAKCNLCEKTYIGETGLLLSSRIKSHKSQSNSALKLHEHSDFKFTMVSRCHNMSRRKITEALAIRDQNPDLNRKDGTILTCFK